MSTPSPTTPGSAARRALRRRRLASAVGCRRARLAPRSGARWTPCGRRAGTVHQRLDLRPAGQVANTAEVIARLRVGRPRPSGRGAAASPAHRPGGRSGSAPGRAGTSARDRWAGSSAPRARRDRGTPRSPDVRRRRPPPRGTQPRRHTQVAGTEEAGKNGERATAASTEGWYISSRGPSRRRSRASACWRNNEHDRDFHGHPRRCARCRRR